jgi:hypothetical protein
MESKVYCTRKIPRARIDMLKREFEVQIHEGPMRISKEKLLKHIADCNA